MGSKRVGLARTQALIEGLKREIQLGQATLVGGKAKLKTTTAATTLTAADSGCEVIWTHDGSGYDITLPSCAAGLHFRFRISLGTAFAHYITVGESTDRFFGVAKVFSDADDQVAVQSQVLAATARKFLHIQSDIATSGGNAGDIIDVIGVDDTHWLVTANLRTENDTPGSIAVFRTAKV